MKIVDMRVVWNSDYGNLPDLQVLVDMIPNLRDFRFKSKPIEQGVFYYGCFEGAVQFFYYNPKDSRGFGGQIYTLTMEDGSKEDIKGPWASRESVAHRLGFGPCISAAVTDDFKSYQQGYTFIRGCLHVSLVKDKIRDLTGAWLPRIPDDDSYIYVPSRDDRDLVKPQKINGELRLITIKEGYRDER